MKILGFEIKKFKNEILPKIQSEQGWIDFLSGGGRSVTHETALKVAVVIRCADVVAKTMASLGCHLYEQKGKSKERAVNHPLYQVLRHLPNPETTAYEFWHMYIMSLMMTKGAYAKVVRNGAGQVVRLVNIPSNAVEVKRNPNTGERYLSVRIGNQTYSYYEFMYTPGLRFSDADNPEDFISIARDVLGLTMDLNSYATDFFQNGSNPGGFVEYPNGIDEAVFMKFKEDWQKAYSGVKNQHKWALLEGGFKLTKMDSNPTDAQALESRKFQILEVCRIMGVPPNKVFEMGNASYASVEQENIGYVQETLSPMDERVCQTIFKDLLVPQERKAFYAKFNLNALLRGDIASRTTYYHNARQDGWMSANDIRDKEEMNAISAEDGGDLYALNGNMIPLSAIPLNLPKGAQNKGGTA